MKELTHLSLFSGIGGLDLAAEWAGIKTVGQCEWAEYPTKVLEKHWPDVQRWKDIRTLTKESFYERTGRRTVDIISGGFPCQPFSVAGKQRGKEDDRYLWPEMVRVIKELRPTWVVGENVAGIVRMALPDILSELEACGYRTRTFLIPACAVGARHRRYRVAIVGYAEHNGSSSATVAGVLEKTGGGQPKGEETAGELAGTGEPGNGAEMGRAGHMENPGCGGCSEQKNVCEQQGRTESKRTSKTLANTESKNERGLPAGEKTAESGLVSSCKDVQHPDGAGCEEQHISKKSKRQEFSGWVFDEGGEEWGTESVLGGMANGIPAGLDRDFLTNHYWDVEPDIPRIASGVEHRVDRLKCLGNAVVPQQFYPIFEAIAAIESGRYKE